VNDNFPDSEKRRCVRLDPCWPVLPGPRYRGIVWNHPSLKDGTLITTSAVVELGSGRIVTRSGSSYELGRTFTSEQQAALEAAAGRRAGRGQSPRELQVIDLESDDLSGLGTFAHERLYDI
jgi:hypothetical protein